MFVTDAAAACAQPRRRASLQAAELLPQAEVDSLNEVMERCEMKDGLAILDLGCGWGSGALHYASKLPNSKVVGVSNSHSQREHILLCFVIIDAAEEKNLATKRPADVKRLAARLAFWEAQSVEPYAQGAIDPSCGEGKPQGTPPAWVPWC